MTGFNIGFWESKMDTGLPPHETVPRMTRLLHQRDGVSLDEIKEALEGLHND